MSTLRPLSRDEVRRIDDRAVNEFRMSGLVLMENAGRGAAELLLRQNVTGPVVIVCGKGNNGGDGYVIARHLEAVSVDVHVLLLNDPTEVTGDAATNLTILQLAGTPITAIEVVDSAEFRTLLGAGDWIVDALLGTGLTGEVREPYRTAIERINDTDRPVLAVDLPSGMDSNTGQPLGVCVKATLTATFVARKVGFDAAGADEWTGTVEALPIGVPRRLLDDI